MKKIKTQTKSKGTGVRMREPQGYASPVEKNLHPHFFLFITIIL